MYKKYISALLANRFGGGGGGGGSDPGPAPVTMNAHNFFDYDGTLLMSFSAAEVMAMTELPVPKVKHEGLIFDGWNWTLEEIKAAPFTFVGAHYKTDDDKIHYIMDITASGSQVEIHYPKSTDWGDGTQDGSTTHTYTKAGRYVIKTDGEMNGDHVCTHFVIEAHYPDNYKPESYFGRQYSRVEAISLPQNSVSSMNDTYQLMNAYVIKYITIPRGWSGIHNYSLQSAYIMTHFSLPSASTQIPYNALPSYGHVHWFVAPPSMNSIRRTGISPDATYTPRAHVVLTGSMPPSLSYKGSLGNSSMVTVYVPDDAVSAYQGATNYVDYTIKGISELITELTGGGAS